MTSRLALLAVVVGLLAPSLVFAQKDRARYREAGKEIETEGDIVEQPTGLELTGADKKKKTISALDVVRVDYTTLEALKLDIGKIEGGDGLKDPAKAVAFYADKVKTQTTAPEKTKRYLAFREAYWSGKLADSKANPDEFKTEAKKAADKMTAFVKANTKTWEQWGLGKSAARLYAEINDWAGAEAVLRMLNLVATATPELKSDVKLSLLGYSVWLGKYSEATVLLADIDGDAKSTPGAKEAAAVYKLALPLFNEKPVDATDASQMTQRKAKLAELAKKLDDAVTKAKFPSTRSAAFGLLGELYSINQMPRDAMWSLLWVDTVYNQNRDDQVMAVNRLVKVFDVLGEKDGDKARAQQFRDRLPKIR
jgi:hypothetical protein